MAEIYTKASDTEMKIANYEDYLSIKGRVTKVVAEEINMTIAELKSAINIANNKLANLDVQYHEALTRLTAEKELADKRLAEAEKLGVREPVREAEKPL